MRAALAQALLIGGGGFAGALLRFGMSGLMHRSMPHAAFPVGTLAVNLTGCLLIGVFAGLVESRQLLGPELRAFAVVGLLGGFTTFSTFGWETFALARDGESLRATANVAAHVLLGLAAVWLGFVVAGPRGVS